MTRYATQHGAYEIDSIPGQHQIAHCHSLFIKREHRGKGHGHAIKAHQMQTLHEMGYDFATCTIDAQNEPQRQILLRAGWQHMSNITNSKTGGITQLWGWSVKELV